MKERHVDDLLKGAVRDAADRRRGSAQESLRAVIDSPTASVDAIVRAAEGLEQVRDPAGAARGYARALQIAGPNSRLAYLQGRSLSDAGDLAGAEQALRLSLALQRDSAPTHNELGIVLAEQGKPEAALAAFGNAVRLDPKYAQAFNNLGNALRSLGRLQEAAAAFAQAARLRPGYALALFNLGVTLRDTGRTKEAEGALRSAVAADAKYRPAFVALANLFRQQGRLDEAAKAYHVAIQLDPHGSSNELAALGYVLAERGDYTESRRAYSTAVSQAPWHLRANIGLRLTLRMVSRSREEIAQLRRSVGNGIAWLRANVDRLAPPGNAASIEGLVWTNFLLAYHGEDDRALQEAYAGFVGDVADRSLPEWRGPRLPAARSGAAIRVGFASTFFTEGTVGMYFRRWVTDLARAPFEIYVYHLTAGMNAVASGLAAVATVFRHLPAGQPRVRSLARTIAADDLDVLIYPEIGMDWQCIALASLRLAPLQCAAWGHPVTTGQTSVDVFFSSAAMEPEDAQRHYSETLVPLPGLGTRYALPPVPQPVSRAELGLPEDAVLLLCPQSLFKIHPDNDELYARILQRVPRARLVLFEGRHPVVTDQFMHRLGEAFERHGLGVRERTVVLPSLAHPEYLRVNQCCDLMLDTLHWSGGNTSLDALACGLPIVTLAGAYMRGRQSAGMLKMVGVDELVAADRDAYVSLAESLATDAERRAALRARIRDGARSLFEDAAPIDALRDYLLSRVARMRGEAKSP